MLIKIYFHTGGQNDFKSTVDNTSDKESTISVEVSSSVRFAKNVTIESAITSSPKPVSEIHVHQKVTL